MPEVGDAFYLEVEYEDVFDGSKIRPVIIIDKRDDNIFLVSTTSQKPKDPCPCGSGKKYKKCCGRE